MITDIGATGQIAVGRLMIKMAASRYLPRLLRLYCVAEMRVLVSLKSNTVDHVD